MSPRSWLWLFLLSLSALARAQTAGSSDLIPYRGHLEKDGAPYSTPVKLKVQLQEANGVAHYEEVFNAVSPVNGDFAITIGANGYDPANDTTRLLLGAVLRQYPDLGVALTVIDGASSVALAGRQRLLAAPFASRIPQVQTADIAAGAVQSADIAAGAVGMSHLSTAGCAAGQLLTLGSGGWGCDTRLTLGTGLDLQVSEPLYLRGTNAGVFLSTQQYQAAGWAMLAVEVSNRFRLDFNFRIYDSSTKLSTDITKLSIDSDGSVRSAGQFTANTTPDLAETIAAAPEVETADVVCADSQKRERAVRCDARNHAVLGVISDGTSSFLINSRGGAAGAPLTGKPLVLAGRVPVKVSGENGPIHNGDWLAPSSLPGVAMRAVGPGPVVGLALDSFNGKTGRVLCFVKAGEGNLAAAVTRLVKENDALRAHLADTDAKLGRLAARLGASRQ